MKDATEQSVTSRDSRCDEGSGGVPGGADVLTIGFGTTVMMWAFGYVGRLPGVMAPSWAIGAGLLICLIGGGAAVGLFTQRGILGAAVTGLITATLNLLILGSLLNDQKSGGTTMSAALWLPGTLLGITAIVTLTAAITPCLRAGPFMPSPTDDNPSLIPAVTFNWSHRFALVAVAATALLLIAGGLVTGSEAGLSVPDWPRSFGYNMFLLPLSRMTGAIYFEHAHRLYGSLVGLTTIALAIHLWIADRRRFVRWLAIIAVVAVVAQGALGGYRVALAKSAQTTTGIAIATPEHETQISTVLRVVHGVFAQIFFAFMFSLAAVCSTTFRRTHAALRPTAVTDRQLSLALVALLLVQLVLGALLRHLHIGALIHITVASAVALLAMACGFRALGMHGDIGPLKKLGIAILALVGLQVALGITAFVAIGMNQDPATPSTLEMLITTAHQFNGALLLAIAAEYALFAHRLLTADSMPKNLSELSKSPMRDTAIGA